MSIPQTAAEAIEHHVSLTLECIDRVYLNVIQHRLQRESNVAWFFRQHRGEAFATAKVMAQMTRSFVADVERFCAEQKVELLTFAAVNAKTTHDEAYHALLTTTNHTFGPPSWKLPSFGSGRTSYLDGNP